MIHFTLIIVVAIESNKDCKFLCFCVCVCVRARECVRASLCGDAQASGRAHVRVRVYACSSSMESGCAIFFCHL
jgi:hypothetical protein